MATSSGRSSCSGRQVLLDAASLLTPLACSMRERQARGRCNSWHAREGDCLGINCPSPGPRREQCDEPVAVEFASAPVLELALVLSGSCSLALSQLDLSMPRLPVWCALGLQRCATCAQSAFSTARRTDQRAMIAEGGMSGRVNGRR